MYLEKTNIRQIAQGDEQAFCQFVKVHSQNLFYYAVSLLQKKELAEEVVSDVFFEVWKLRTTLEEIKNLKAYLLTLTHNKAVSYLRKENFGRMFSIEDIQDVYLPSFQSADCSIISQEEMSRINQAIQTLPPKCKQVFILAKIEGLAYKEIAQMLNISVKTINIHIAKALALISSELEK